VSFLEIFQPGLKQLREERDRQKMLVVRLSNGGGAPIGLDLDAGKATNAVTPHQFEPDEPDAQDTGPA
jgi:Family of unknown function (DUF6191)